jgi:hypothetical protein
MSQYLAYIIQLLFIAFLLAFLIPTIGNKVLNIELDSSTNDYIDRKEEYEIVLIGSSKFQHQIIEKELEIQLDRKVYNLGLGATNPPETYVHLVYLLENGHLDNKDIVLEVRAVTEISYKNWWLSRSTYWLNYDNLKKSINLIDDSRFGRGRKILAKISFISNFISNKLNVNLLRDSYLRPYSSGISEFGYVALESNSIDCEKLKEVNSYVGSSEIQTKAIENSFHLEYLNELINLSNNRNSNLILFLADTNLKWQLETLVPLFRNIPYSNKIMIYDPEEFPFLNDCSIKNNVTHFDLDGSKLFTKAVGDGLAKIIEQ